jgi:glycogen debranching enzyme
VAEPVALPSFPFQQRIGASDAVTLVEESCFAISSSVGDMEPGRPQGLFFSDTRILSRLRVTLDGKELEPLAASTPNPFSALFVSRIPSRPGADDSTILVLRSRYVGRGMREDIVVRNYGLEPSYRRLAVRAEADLASLFDVKEGLALGEQPARPADFDTGSIYFEHAEAGIQRGVRIRFSQVPNLIDGTAYFELVIAPEDSWSVCLEVTPVVQGSEVEPLYRCGDPVERAAPVQRLARWRRDTPVLSCSHEGLASVVRAASQDLAALRMPDPERPDRMIVAAGAPWFMALFGRDSLITSWMALLFDLDLAMGTLQTLARFQGKDVDPRTDEQPGRILHELRMEEAASLSIDAGTANYGSVDATPLFVMLLGETVRWGAAGPEVEDLVGHADRALEWIRQFGDRDGDGYVEYQRLSDRGQVNQGWKDSWDSVRYRDGQIARPPIALCEVQGYVYAAYLARAELAEHRGETAAAASWRREAAQLKEAFNRDFWLEDLGWFALGLDRNKRPIDALASNMGHCLWTGIVDEDKAEQVARRLCAPEMFSGWGVRTLGANMPGYNPISYHCGSVWPHDTAIAVAGLMRYGFVEEASRIALGLLDAGWLQGGRLPELFSGLPREETSVVVSYPTSCSPQAWAAASALLVLRAFLRLDPDVPAGRIWAAPALPAEIGRLRIEGIALGPHRLTVEVEGTRASFSGLSGGIQLLARPRPAQG